MGMRRAFGGIAQTDGEDFDALFGGLFGGLGGVRFLVLAVGYKHDNLIVVGPGRHGFDGLADGVADERAAAGRTVGIDLVEHRA